MKYVDKRKEKIHHEVFVEGNKDRIADMFVGKFLTTRREYYDIMGGEKPEEKEENHPVASLNWYECVQYCNKLSEREGLEPAYTINGKEVTLDLSKDGYYLPLSEEWLWFASGGNKSKGFEYSGSNNSDEVAWSSENSGGRVHQVGMKKPNELGIYDCSGLLWEWSSSSEK